ncbi:hypothetical protein SUGI_0504400 [Cryptomeria japonica]|nr:hypothetical protein SUGI_0504400 [Cryptomeria japonica]
MLPKGHPFQAFVAVVAVENHSVSSSLSSIFGHLAEEEYVIVHHIMGFLPFYIFSVEYLLQTPYSFAKIRRIAG